MATATKTPQVRKPQNKAAGKFKRASGRMKHRKEPKKRDSVKDKGKSFVELPASQLRSEVFRARVQPPTLDKFTPQTVKLAKVTTLATEDSRQLLDAYGVPIKLLLDFRILGPTTVTRNVTLQLIDRLKTAASGASQNSRIVLHGQPGCGKSYCLLQAVHYCHAADWITIYVPRATKLMDSTTSIAYDPRTRTYMQHTFARQILERIKMAEAKKLSLIQIPPTLRAEHSHISVKDGHLLTLVDIGLEENAPCMDYLAALFDVLSTQTQYPVLLAIDDFQALYHRSKYRDPQFLEIHSYHLSLPRLFMEYANSFRQFQRGAIVGAIGSQERNFPTSLELAEALDIPVYQPTSPYSKRIKEYITYTRGLEPFEIAPRLSMTEAAALFDVYRQHGTLHSALTDESFLAKYTEADGNARDFVCGGLSQTLQ